jgi:hypothetical protein
MSEERRQKQIQRMVEEATSKNKKWFPVGAIGVVIAVVIPLYIARPNVEPQNIFIECAICDDPAQIHPPENAQDNGAVIRLVVENTGNLGTKLLQHNMTTRVVQPEIAVREVEFSETADANDGINIGLGAHKTVTFARRINEVIIYDIRHGSPRDSTIGKIESAKLYLYGHVRYRGAFYFPTTTNFCFEYVKPTKGLPESWGVCTQEISDLANAKRDP